MQTGARFGVGVVLTCWILTAGCVRPAARLPLELREIKDPEAVVQRIDEDPVKFLRDCLAETAKARQFTAHFQRQERLGLFAELRPLENIQAEHREAPFSVRFTWMGGDSEYQQCVYVQGRDEDKVVLLPRKGLLGLPPEPQSYPPEMAVTFGKSRNPITDFGPRRMLERTLDRIEKAAPLGGVKIKVLPPVELPPADEPCYHLELRFPEGDPFKCKLQDLYIRMRTYVPVATWLWLPGSPERTSATLDGMYVYAGINPDAVLTDANFVIEAERIPAKGSGKNAGKGKGKTVEKGKAQAAKPPPPAESDQPDRQ